MLRQSRSSSRVDAASLLASTAAAAANCFNEAGLGDSRGTADVLQLPLAQRARLSASASNLRKLADVDKMDAILGGVDVVDEKNNGAVFSPIGNNNLEKLLSSVKTDRSNSNCKNANNNATSSLGRYASKLRSQLPPIHFGFNNTSSSANNPENKAKKQSAAANSAANARQQEASTSGNGEASRNSRASIQRSSSNKIPSALPRQERQQQQRSVAAADDASKNFVDAASCNNNNNNNNNNATFTVDASSIGKIGSSSRGLFCDQLTSIERLRNWKAKLPSIRVIGNGWSTSANGNNNKSNSRQKPVGDEANRLEEDDTGGFSSKVNNRPGGIDTVDNESGVIVGVSAKNLEVDSRFAVRVELASGDGLLAPLGVAIADTSALENMTSNTTVNSRLSVGKYNSLTENSDIGCSAPLATDDENKVYEEIDFPGWSIPSGGGGRRSHSGSGNKDKHGNRLPPPARITPFSGVPQNKIGEVVRPTAFRPFTSSAGVSTADLPQSVKDFAPNPTLDGSTAPRDNPFVIFTATGFNDHSQSGAFGPPPPLPPPRHALKSVSPRITTSFSSAMESHDNRKTSNAKSDTDTLIHSLNAYNYNGKSDGQQPTKYPSDTESQRILSSYYSGYHQRVAPHGPAGKGSNSKFFRSPPSDNNGEIVGGNKQRMQHQQQESTAYRQQTNGYIFAKGDHDYDLVISTAVSNSQSKPSYLFPASSVADNGFVQKRPLPNLPANTTNGTVDNQFLTSSKYTNSFSYSGNSTAAVRSSQQLSDANGATGQQSAANYYSTSGGSYSSRNSSGIHATPSPSDSGMVELESVLKEKESELMQLRQTMEHNEQVIVRVYQEKEERWQEKLREWASRLEQAVSTEQRLLSQIQRLQDDRAQLQATVQTLLGDKRGLQKKCKELEYESQSMKRDLQEEVRTVEEHRPNLCPRCDASLSSTDRNNSGTSYSLANNSNNVENYDKPQSSLDDELRNENDTLKDQVSSLRKSMQEQTGKFSQERKSWEIEKQRVLQYHKILQDSYNRLLVQNGVQSADAFDQPCGTVTSNT